MKNEVRNDPHFIRLLAQKIHDLSEGSEKIKIMHVCGTHEHTIVASGLRSLLPKNVFLVSGPGCPVCITPQEDIERMIFLAEHGLTITTFGDMLNIPTSSGSLADAKARGADIRVVYGISNALAKDKKEEKEVVHFGIGFETTVPTSSVALLSEPDNFSILSVHRTIPEALEFLMKNDLKVDGLIDPGHVSSIIGVQPYVPVSKKYKISQVISGFEPGDIMLSVYMLLCQISEQRSDVENEYVRAVRENGNKKAKDMINQTFERVDAAWRALPIIPGSGLAIRKRFEDWDALCRHEDILSDFVYEFKEDSACRCKEILLGVCSSEECPLFRSVCTPDSPIGPCMVSAEGTCNISYIYGQS